jgi:hypothetical protein
MVRADEVRDCALKARAARTTGGVSGGRIPCEWAGCVRYRSEWICAEPMEARLTGLPEYSAPMERFFEKHRALLRNVGKRAEPAIQLWQGFRQSTVCYLCIPDGLPSQAKGRDEELAIHGR